MAVKLKSLKQQIKNLHSRTKTQSFGATKDKLYNGKTLLQYRGDPEGYAEHVMGSKLTPDQLAIARAVDEGNCRVFCRAGHTVGKSWTVAFLVSYLYDTYEEVVIMTTAPRLESVRDIVWREIRSQRRKAGLGGFSGPRSVRLQDGPNHLAFGTTARSHTGFQGKHGIRVFIFVDEAVGLETEFWEAIDSMLQGEKAALLAIYNPTTTACQVYSEEKQKNAKVHTLNCLNHPNIDAELKLNPPPYPSAVRLNWVIEHVEKYCDALHPGDVPDPSKGDFQFPPAWAVDYCQKHKIQPRWWRSTPRADGRIFGKWPETNVDSFWSPWLVNKCRANRIEIKPNWPTQIGCDVARYGDDLTEIIVRRGPCVVHHEAHSGWNGKQVAARLKVLCHQHCGPQTPQQVKVVIDETGGWGSSTIDHAGEDEQRFNFIGVNASSEPRDKKLHKNLRAELWATTVELAKAGLVDLSRLPKDAFNELEKQLLFQKYELLNGDVIKAVDKDDIKKELKRSPDTADALNLSYFRVPDSHRKPDKPMKTGRF